MQIRCVLAYQPAIAKNGQIYTTDYVLDETITLFFRRLPAPRADQSMKVLLSAFSAENFYLQQFSCI
jgi:predicted nucleic acid-binding protein